ncbi:4-hydroxy-tetrahydrodipicolinate synthase [Arthrobacter tecti]
MKSQAPFGALLTAMVTPFTNEGKLDLETAAQLAEELVSNGVDGLVVCGTAGEATTLRTWEKTELIRVAKRTVGDHAKVIAGTGTNDTAQSVMIAERAAEAGADGQLVVTPYYSKPSQSGVIEHMTRIADAADLPVMLYDIPGRAGIALSNDSMKRLADHPRIVAVKDAKADLASTTVVLQETNLAVYSGDDALTLPWLAAGAAGLVSVSANVAPGPFKELIQAVSAGDLTRARALNFQLAPLVRAVMSHVPPAVAAKVLLHRRGGLPSDAVRGPLSRPLHSELSCLETELHGTEWALN